jgi:hypothetical protein
LHSGPTPGSPRGRASRRSPPQPGEQVPTANTPASVDAWWTRASNLPSTVLAEQGKKGRALRMRGGGGPCPIVGGDTTERDGREPDLRVEQIRAAELGKQYPRCTGGRRAGPPEDWGGPWEFVQRTQQHLVFGALLRAAEIIGQLLDADTGDQLTNILGADRDELAELLPLLGLELFDRKACNQALVTCAAGAVEGSRR